MTKTVKDVVFRHLCTQCGTCVAVCPQNAIEMQETPSGMLTPLILEEKCVQCGTCRKLCPGLAVEIKPQGVDPFKGNVCAAFVGHACDDFVRYTGQSGGVVSAILIYLLETNQINAALVTVMPANGTLRPEPILARKRSEILAAQGSKYCPVAANKALKDITAGDHIATVGVSCQIHGIQALMRDKESLRNNIKYKIGLFCDRTMFYTCIDMMSKNAGIKRKRIESMEFRSKKRNGWPGEVCFQLHSGNRRYFPAFLRTSVKDYFTPPRCRLCFDKLNVLSDLSIGDPWGLCESDTKNSSVIIARNDKALSLLNNACNNGFLKLKEISAELIYEGQGVEQRRRNFTAFSAIWHEMGRTLPEYRGLDYDLNNIVHFNEIEVLRRKLLLNCHIAESTNKQAALATVKRQMLKDRKKSPASKPLKKLKKKLKRLLKVRSFFL